jgi:glycosyltransferase involved in cell wall biosynthesis
MNFQDWAINQFQLNTLNWVLYGLALILLITSIYIIYSTLIKVSKYPVITPITNGLPPISVIIAARNEFDNLKELISSLLLQSYPQFEIILMNDGSVDGTDEWATVFAQQEPRFKYTFLNPDVMKAEGKKIALTLGIKKASYDNFVFIDGDCKVHSPDYLKYYGTLFNQDKNLILGVSLYHKNKGFLNKYIQHQTTKTALTYLSAAISGKPYMGVGRNMGYTRSIYKQVNGFESHYDIPCGDDDLFVQDVMTIANVAVLLEPDSQTSSDPKIAWNAYMSQRLRHMWAGKFYKPIIKFNLSVRPIIEISLFIILFTAAIINYKWVISVFFIMIWITFVLYQFNKAKKRISASNSTLGLLILSPFNYLFQVFMGIKLYFTKNIKW